MDHLVAEIEASIEMAEVEASRVARIYPNRRDDLVAEAYYWLVSVFNQNAGKPLDQRRKMARVAIRHRLTKWHPYDVRVPKTSYDRGVRQKEGYTKVAVTTPLEEATFNSSLANLSRKGKRGVVLDIIINNEGILKKEICSEAGVCWKTLKRWQQQWREQWTNC